MKTKTMNGVFKLILLVMTSLMLVSVSAPVVQHVFADDTTSSDKKDDKNDGKKDDSSDSASSSSNYKNLMVPSILSTAYADGLKLASGNSEADDKAYQKFYGNITNILAYQNSNNQHVFSNVGTMFGQVGLSSGSSTNDIASLSSVTKSELDSRFSVGNDKLGLAYLNFGNAYTNLISHANKRDTSSVGTESVMMGLTAVSGKVANIGATILSSFSPAPLVMAFRDSSVLTDAKYDDNKLIKIVRDNEIIGNIVRFFGDPAPGFPQVSTADAIVVAIIVFTTGLSLLSVFMNGRQFGMSLRKTMVKVLVVAVAIPLGARLFDFGTKLLSDTASTQANSPDAQIVKSNLLLGPWANVTKFGLPEGTTLSTRDGEFLLTPSNIYSINMYVAQKAGVIKNTTDDDADKKVAKYIKNSITADKNETTIGWTNLIRSSTKTPWKTDKLLQVADALGGNKDINKDVKIEDIGYLTEGGLISTADGTQFSQTGVSDYGFGMTPLAAFNIVNTTFDSNKLSVKSNLVNNLTLPTVAVGANTYMYGETKSKDDDAANRTISMPISFVLNLVMLFAAFSAMARILSAGFGGMLHGGASSAFGSAAGWGELTGAVIALIGGILGLSIIITVLDGAINSIWNLLMDAIMLGKHAIKVDDVLPANFLDSIGSIKWLGKFLVELLSSVVNFILSLVALIILPKLIKIPIEAFGTWAAGLPGYMSEKAQAMENKFTGDYRSGGNSGGNHMANAAAKAAAKSRAQNQALKTGAAMLAGAGLNHVLNRNSNSSVTGDTNNNSEDKNKDGLITPNDSVTSNPENKDGAGDMNVDDATSTTDTNEMVDGDVVDENESVDATQIDGNDVSEESQESVEDSDNFESVTGGSVDESSVQNSSDAAQNVNTPSEGDTSDSVSGDAVGGSTDNATGDGAVNASESGAVDAKVEANSDSSVVDESQDGESIQSFDSAQSIESSSDQESVTNDGNVSDSSTNVDGAQEVNSSDSVSSRADAINESHAKVDASSVSSDKSVTSEGGVDNSSSINSKADNATSQSTKAINAGDKTSNVSNKSVTGSASNGKRAQVSSRASRLVNSVKNNSIVQNVAGTAKGDVTSKEQAIMGATHMAAAVVGAEGITQRGVDNVNGRKGSANKDANKASAGKEMSNGMRTRDEASIRQQESEDKRHRDRKQAGGGKPVTRRETGKPKNSSSSNQTRKFFETVSDKK